MKKNIIQLLKKSKVELSLREKQTRETKKIQLSLKNDKNLIFTDENDQFKLRLFVSYSDNNTFVSYRLENTFKDDSKLYSMDFFFSLKDRDYLTFNNDTPFWTTPHFFHSNKDFKDNTRLFYFFEQAYYSVFSLSDDAFHSTFTSDGLKIEFFNQGIDHVFDFIVISKGKTFASSYNRLLSCLREKKKILSPRVKEKRFPKNLEGLGYATWNAFYRDFNEEKLYSLLDEFQEKGIHLDFFLLDDGWSEADKNYRLLSFQEDKTKFPHGIKRFVQTVKKKYGIKHVGVWHALNGYWNGVVPENFPGFRFYKNQEGNSFVNINYEDAFHFYDAWYQYLTSVGIDFVKVDNQSGYFYSFYKDREENKDLNYLSSLTQIKKTLEDAAQKHFGNNLINCMEMDFDIMNNTSIGIERNSGDYAPDNPNDLKRFLVENIYNSLYHSKTAILDYDMFLTNRNFLELNAIVRVLSGGPIYITDEPGKIRKDIIDMLYTDGKILRMPRNLRPTYDVLYKLGNSPIKCFNDFNHKYVFLSVGVEPGQTQKAAFRLSDLGLTKDYLIHDYLKNTYFKMTKKDVLEYSLNYGEYLLLSLYPLKDGNALVGASRSILEIMSRMTHKERF